MCVCVLLGSYNFEAKNSTLNNSVNKTGILLLHKKRKQCVRVLNGNKFYLSIPLFLLTQTALLGHLAPGTFKEGDADVILETDISTSLLQLSFSLRDFVLFALGLCVCVCVLLWFLFLANTDFKHFGMGVLTSLVYYLSSDIFLSP